MLHLRQERNHWHGGMLELSYTHVNTFFISSASEVTLDNASCLFLNTAMSALVPCGLLE
jgi:hypothetical protein